MTINFELLKAIKMKGMTQGKFGQKIGMSETRFSRIINGLSTPTDNEIKKISGALKLPVEQLGFKDSRISGNES